MPPPVTRRRTVLVAAVAAGVVVLVLAVYSLLVFLVGDRVPRGTTVAGVPIGGLSRTAAESRLAERLSPAEGRPMRITVADSSYRLEPQAAGLALDIPGSVDAAYAERSFNPVTTFRTLTGGDELPPVLDVDERRLDRALTDVAKSVDKPPREGSIKFENGRAEATKPRTGHELDRDAAAARVRAAFLVADGPVELPTVDRAPLVDAAEVERAMRELAEPAMAGPISVKVGTRSFRAEPAEIGAALRMVADDKGRLQPKLSGKAFAKEVGDRLAKVETEPEDAEIRIEGGTPTVIPAEQGHTVPEGKLAEAVVDILPRSGTGRVARVKTVTADPKLTTAAAEKLGVEEVTGEFTTYFPHAAYRNTNIGRAAELIDGTLLKPGETFSLNDQVGERTEANGFTVGYVIKGGRLREELGGGVSQLATTTYNAGFFAGMEDVEHRPHGFYIDRYPVGREATVYWGSLDLRFRNNTPYGVLVQATVDPSTPGSSGVVTVRVWSTKYWTVRTETSGRYNQRAPKKIYDPKPGCVDQEGVEGFDVDVHRWLYRNGSLVDQERDHVSYGAEDNIICSEPPPPPKQDAEQPPD